MGSALQQSHMALPPARYLLQFAYVYQAKPASRRGFMLPFGPSAARFHWRHRGAGAHPFDHQAGRRCQNVIGEIYARFEKAGLKVVAQVQAAVAP